MPAKRMFGFKDVFTTGNLLGGVVALCLCIEGNTFGASVAILIGWIFDALDGQVARLMNESNRFGAEYDTISDHLSHAIAPAAIVFTTYRDMDLGLSPRLTWWVAIAMASMIIVTASVRHARNVVHPVEFEGIWVGLPRTVVGFLALGYCNSQVLPLTPGGGWFGVAICVASSVVQITSLPFLNHRLGRRFPFPVRLAITLTFLTTFGVLVVARQFAFDVLMFWMIGYSLASWIAITPDERRKFAAAVAAAKARGEVPAST